MGVEKVDVVTLDLPFAEAEAEAGWDAVAASTPSGGGEVRSEVYGGLGAFSGLIWWMYMQMPSSNRVLLVIFGFRGTPVPSTFHWILTRPGFSQSLGCVLLISCKTFNPIL